MQFLVLKMQSEIKLSTLFRREYLLTVEEDQDTSEPFQVIFKALSVRDLDFIKNLQPHTETNQINLYIVEKSVIKLINAKYSDGSSIPLSDIWRLPVEVVAKLAKSIIEVSLVKEEIITKIRTNIALVMDSKYHSDTWDCEVCKSRSLDSVRNCKFRSDYSKIFDSSFELLVDSVKYDHCPMYYKDSELVSDVFNCFHGWEQGILPEAGGLVDQTEFFMVATALVRKYKNELEAKNK